jgi:hypothetical protein
MFLQGVIADLENQNNKDKTCGTEVVFPSLNIKRALPLNEPVVIEVYAAGQVGRNRFCLRDEDASRHRHRSIGGSSELLVCACTTRRADPSHDNRSGSPSRSAVSSKAAPSLRSTAYRRVAHA